MADIKTNSTLFKIVVSVCMLLAGGLVGSVTTSFGINTDLQQTMIEVQKNSVKIEQNTDKFNQVTDLLTVIVEQNREYLAYIKAKENK